MDGIAKDLFTMLQNLAWILSKSLSGFFQKSVLYYTNGGYAFLENEIMRDRFST